MGAAGCRQRRQQTTLYLRHTGNTPTRPTTSRSLGGTGGSRMAEWR
jgi:hypothetical protein